MTKLTTINAYLETVPKTHLAPLLSLRAWIQEEAPQATEAIAYGLPTFKLNGNLVHFGAGKTHIGFYPTPSAIEAFASSLSSYKTSKGAVQFPLDKPLPEALIRDMVRFRVKEQQG